MYYILVFCYSVTLLLCHASRCFATLAMTFVKRYDPGFL